ncbi:MAG TPA: VWA domain-containing protein, partial [Polyangiaceae bacterium LLY-WYZ-15_(1-7)]|nr:VWA domain-containing protein [Polyangiaceae bacterium LLY-WYZ-15_(1-7)]
FDDGRRASLAIVIDDSMSMGREDGGRTLLAEAVERAAEAVEALPEGSEVSLVLAGGPARLEVPRTSSPEAALRALRRLPARTGRGTDLPEAVRLARRSLAGARRGRRLWVLSDFAAHGGVSELELPSDGFEVALERVGGEEPPENRAIVEATGAPDPTTPGQVSVRVVVRGPDGEVPVRVEQGDALLSAGRVRLAGGLGRVTLHVPEQPFPAATVRLGEADALPADDARPMLLVPPAAARVLLVDGDPHPARARDEVGFLSRALDAAPRRDGGLRYRTVDADAWAPADLEDVDVVVLANAPAPSPVLAAALRRHVAGGGGLLVTGGDQVQPRAYRARLGELLPATLSPARSPGLLATEAEAGLPRLEGVPTRRALGLEPELGAEVWARFDDGGTALVAQREGRGRVAVLATSVDDDWSELPYRPGFLPFSVELLRRLASGRASPRAAVEAGEALPLPPGARVRRPDGEVLTVGEEGLFEATELPGVHALLDEAGEAETAFVVTSPASESELAPAPLPDLEGAGGGQGEGGVLSRRPVDPWLFLLAGLFLLAEGVLRTRKPKTA